MGRWGDGETGVVRNNTRTYHEDGADPYRTDTVRHVGIKQQRDEDEEYDLPVEAIGEGRQEWVDVRLALALDDQRQDRDDDDEDGGGAEGIER